MKVEPFTYDGLPARVVFGHATLARLGDEAERLGIARALVLSTPGRARQAEGVAERLGGRAAGTFAGAEMHTPVEATEKALEVVRETGADGLVAIGGGSTIGLGKAIAARTDLPQIAIPTTYSGSEMTPILGETADGVKTTRRDLKVLPETVIYDVELTLALPLKVAGPSGMNAIAHAVEALYAEASNPVTSLMAEEGIRALAAALPVIAADASDAKARGEALYGACLCGIVLGSVGMALHHKLCHTLGGAFGLPHAETHTIVLPHAIAYNAPAAPAAMARAARALGAAEAATALYQLAKRVGAPVALRDIGMPGEGLDRAADLAVASPYWNPRPVERDAVRTLLDDAWHGREPARAAHR
ncbi:MAG TPA: maleylacetate reductase [Afifellaceae bacterium]|nr:maleylacetate reductase [Afifellaceae bacterium]